MDPLFTLTFPYGAYHAFDVSADGTRFLVNTVLGAQRADAAGARAARPEAARMIERLTGRKEWMFFAALPRAGGALAIAWWAAVVLRGVLPAVFAIAMGALVAAVQRGDSLTPSLAVVGAAFVLLQVLTPIQTAISLNLGDRTAAFLYDRLTAACVRPAGMGHLEDPSLTADMTAARDFDLGMTGPPLSYSMDFIAGGLVGMLTGLTAAVVLAGFAWWAPIVLGGAWLSTHWLLRESAVWHDRQTDEVRGAQRDADYAYRLAVDPPASKELRLFGLVQWTIDRFVARRTRLHDLQYQATRLRERPLAWSALIVTAANVLVLWALAAAAADGRIDLGQLVTYAQLAVSTSAIAFGGFSWALDGASAPVAAVGRLEPAMRAAGRLDSGARDAAAMPAREVRFRGVTLRLPGRRRGAEGLRPDDSRGLVAGDRRPERRRQDHVGQAPVPPLRPAGGRDRDRRRRSPGAGAVVLARAPGRRVSGLHPLRAAAARQRRAQRRARRRGSGRAARRGRRVAGALDTVLARGYDGGTDLSGGQWQRVALARALCAVKMGAGLVLLDEPTAQLDVRGEAEIFDRILATTRHCTTILISHRFSTVRHADRICVLEKGRVVELGTHDELMALDGRYRTMFDLQAQRFGEDGRRPDV